MSLVIRLILAPLLMAIAVQLPAQTQLIISNGPRPAAASTIFFNWPGRSGVLTDKQTGRQYPVQQIGEQGVIFYENLLQPYQEVVLDWKPGVAESAMKADSSAGAVQLSSKGKPVLAYQVQTRLPANTAASYARSGFVHPLYSPAGKILTDDFPLGHTHQHAMFTAWTSTTFRGKPHDFWNQMKEQTTVAHQTVSATVSGPVMAGLTARLAHNSVLFGQVLDETWELRVYPGGEGYYVVDLFSDQANISSDTFYLDAYHYGGFGLRGSATWNESDHERFISMAQFLTSEGMPRAAADHTRPRWTAIYGDFETGQGGVAVMDHPSNLRFPQYIRVHPHMPYFSQTPVVGEGYALAPGAHLKAQYRLMLFDGAPDVTLLERAWESWSHPLQARWK